MTLTDAFAVLTRNGFTPDESKSIDNSQRIYACSVEKMPMRYKNQGEQSGIPRAEVSYSKATGIVARAGNLPKE